MLGTGSHCVGTGSNKLSSELRSQSEATRGNGVAGRAAPDLRWHKSSTSEESNCVEVAVTHSSVLVRNSRARSGKVLSFTCGEWDAFLARVRNNEFSVGVSTASS
jgi:hypothetical protein